MKIYKKVFLLIAFLVFLCWVLVQSINSYRDKQRFWDKRALNLIGIVVSQKLEADRQIPNNWFELTNTVFWNKVFGSYTEKSHDWYQSKFMFVSFYVTNSEIIGLCFLQTKKFYMDADGTMGRWSLVYGSAAFPDESGFVESTNIIKEFWLPTNLISK